MNGSFPDFAALVTSRDMVYLLASECDNYISVYHWQNEVLNEIQNIEMNETEEVCFTNMISNRFIALSLIY